MDKLKELANYHEYEGLMLKSGLFNLENDEVDEKGDSVSKIVVFEADNGDKIHVADCKNNNCATHLVCLFNNVYVELHKNGNKPEWYGDFADGKKAKILKAQR